MKIHDISIPISPTMPTYPGDPAVSTSVERQPQSFHLPGKRGVTGVVTSQPHRHKPR